jgi:uracil-DNA glycosylase
MTTDYDRGPSPAFAAIFEAVPAPPDPASFWTDWGPVFYRGRLDGSARILCIASDPGATERIGGRTLVGHAGQRVQGFLAKLGLTRSYLCLNAFPYALHPSKAAHAPQMLAEPVQREWRNQLYDLAAQAPLEAIVAFGVNARNALTLWPTRPQVPLVEIPHPTSHDEHRLLTEWAAAISQLRAVITPDPDGDADAPNYRESFSEADYAPIPRGDLPFGVPWFLGDDRWARQQRPPLDSTVTRPRPDDHHTLIWVAPPTHS